MSNQGDGMAEVTEADREKAREVVLKWTHSDLDVMRLSEDIAAALAEERQKARTEVGRCGEQGLRIFTDAEPPVCELAAGHAGWHREGATEWGIRRAAEVNE